MFVERIANALLLFAGTCRGLPLSLAESLRLGVSLQYANSCKA